jgi:replicative DNA helicase
MTTERRRREPGARVIQLDQRSAAPTANLILEATVLGALLAENGIWPEISFLSGEDFAEPAHQVIFEACAELLGAGRAATPGILSQRLGADLQAYGGSGFLADLVAYGQTAVPAIGEAARQLRAATLWRRLQAVGARLQEDIRRGGDAPEEVASAAIRALEEALLGAKPTARSKREVARAAYEMAARDEPRAETGIEGLDLVTQGGLVARRLYAIGAEFGRGKTILLGSISHNLNTDGVRHLFLSMETPPEDIEIRNIARGIGQNATLLNDPTHPQAKILRRNAERYLQKLQDHTWYEFLPGATMDDINRVILHAVHRHKVQGVIIDYWQLIRGREKGVSEEAHLRDCANRLAALARRLGIWILMACQTDAFGKPLISSGILQAASLFIRLQRDPNDQQGFFTTEKSNYGPLADGGTPENPGIIFDLQGPYFRSPGPEDHAMMGRLDTEDRRN